MLDVVKYTTNIASSVLFHPNCTGPTTLGVYITWCGRRDIFMAVRRISFVLALRVCVSVCVCACLCVSVCVCYIYNITQVLSILTGLSSI